MSMLWDNILGSLSEREHDCPFALLYAPEFDARGDDELIFQLRGSIGDFGNNSVVAHVLNLNGTSSDRLNKNLSSALTTEDPVLLTTEDGSLPESWSKAAKTRGWEEACTEAVVLPLQSNRYHKVRALLVLGVSTRTNYDAVYKSWNEELRRLIGSTIHYLRRKEIAAQEIAQREKTANTLSRQYSHLVKVMELSDVGIFSCDRNGNLLEANESWYRLSTVPRQNEPVPAFSWLESVYDEDKDLVMSHWHSMLQGKPVTYQMRWKHPDRPEGRWILAVCLPVMDENGKIVSIAGCTTDIDAQKRVEKDALQALQALERASASEQRFLRFTASSPVAVHIIEMPSRMISFCNSAWFEMLGITPVPVSQLDSSWTDGILEQDLPLLQDTVQRILATHEPQTTQFRFRRMFVSGDGHRYQSWGSSMSHAELDENGAVKAIMTTTTDISHLKWAEDVQKSRVEEALEAKRQNEVFIDMTSHEIRNPLGAVVHCADAIDESLEEMKSIMEKLQLTDKKAGQRLHALIESSAEAVQTITSCSSHQRRIVDDLLTLSKLDSNLLQINQSPVRATSILDDMQRIFEIEGGRAHIELRIQADPSIKAMNVDNVMLDTGRVHQILINLITNALKFTKDRPKRCVTITMGASKTRPSDGALSSTIDFALPHTLSDTVRESEALCTGPETFFIWFTVSDTGRGIKPEEKIKLFSRFQQASPRTYAKYGGSGLGLFISRELAELQGGEIGIATELDVGSTFAFFVKTRPAAAPVEQRLKDELALRPRSGSAQTSFSNETAQIHVLVAEDNQVNQKVLKRQLTNKGYVVWTADNGQEAVDFLRQTCYWNSPDKEQGQEKELHVILMDTEMPVMDGLTAAKKIREMQRSGELKGHVPILSVSANARPEQTSMAIAAGMDDSISKPFRIADLTPKIDRLADLAHAS
ncbi:putative histidine kinase HHK19p, partial [Aureobasidium melanogenum]